MPKSVNGNNSGKTKEDAQRPDLLFRGRAGPVDQRAVLQVSKTDCLASLARFAPLAKEMEPVLAIPGQIYSNSDRTSFSTEQQTDLSELSASLVRTSIIRGKLPDYGLHISSAGSSTFCTLVDKSRKIIVFASIGNIHAGEGSWARFQNRVEAALQAVKRVEGSKNQFSFVINNDGALSLI